MNFSQRTEPPMFLPRVHDCDPPLETRTPTAPREGQRFSTVLPSPPRGPPQDTGYVCHPSAVPPEVIEREATRKRFEKSEPSRDARHRRDHQSAFAPRTQGSRSAVRVSLGGVETQVSRDVLLRFADYFGKEPVINALLRTPEGAKALRAVLDRSETVPMHIYLEPYQMKLIKWMRDGKNCLVSMPLHVKKDQELPLVAAIADHVRWRIGQKEDTKSIIMVQNGARGHAILRAFKDLNFARVQFFSSTTGRKSWKKLIESLDVLIILSESLIGLLTAGSGNFRDVDILVVDDCENVDSMDSPAQVLGLPKKENIPPQLSPQIIGITKEPSYAKKGGFNMKKLQRSLCVDDSKVKLLNRNGAERWPYKP